MILQQGPCTVSRTNSIGFPQGGVCSPKFWALAFHPAVEIINTPETKGVAFADNCAVLCGGVDPEEMLMSVQTVLDRLVQWGTTCRLEFNSAKTEAVFFTRTRQLPTRPLTIQNEAVPYRLQVRYLGNNAG